MVFKLFTDLIDALEKVAKGFKALKDIPKKERDKFREVMDETYRLIDTTLNMVIIRLGDILLPKNAHEFAEEVSKLNNYDGWVQAEREFRLCRSLRVALRETQSLSNRLIGSLSTQDWGALLHQMESVLATEGEVALFIGKKFYKLVDSASKETPDKTRKKVIEFRNALKTERETLIKQEIELYSIV
jgi:hypothetical protein